jgi:predicted solute-binding protein
MGQSVSQLGWIPYLNLRPLKVELDRLCGGHLQFKSGHPSSVNQWLCDHSVSIAPASSINLLRSESLEIAAPIGVASRGPVMSVYLGYHREHAWIASFIEERQKRLKPWFERERLLHSKWSADTVSNMVEQKDLLAADFDLKNLWLKKSKASEASNGLARIFLSLWFGREGAESLLNRVVQPSDGPCLELVIGDEALIRRPEFFGVLDLGELWWELVGLPFVFAIWQTHLDVVPAGFRSLLISAAEHAELRMRVEPQVYIPESHPVDSQGSPLDLARYWGLIDYRLSAEHMKGLMTYLRLYSSMFGGDFSNRPMMPARFAKWSAKWAQR